jgi:hypothetical protein
MLTLRKAMFALAALPAIAGEPLHAATPPVTARGPDEQINMYIVSQMGAHCSLTRNNVVIWRAQIIVPETGTVGESDSFFVTDTAKNHDPIAVECSAPGFETSSVLVNYEHSTGTAFVVCPSSGNMTDQERRAAEDCERRTSGKTVLFDRWSYPDRVVVHLRSLK